MQSEIGGVYYYGVWRNQRQLSRIFLAYKYTPEWWLILVLLAAFLVWFRFLAPVPVWSRPDSAVRRDFATFHSFRSDFSSDFTLDTSSTEIRFNVTDRSERWLHIEQSVEQRWLQHFTVSPASMGSTVWHDRELASGIWSKQFYLNS